MAQSLGDLLTELLDGGRVSVVAIDRPGHGLTAYSDIATVLATTEQEAFGHVRPPLAPEQARREQTDASHIMERRAARACCR
jgi:hypothetical protein